MTALTKPLVPNDVREMMFYSLEALLARDAIESDRTILTPQPPLGFGRREARCRSPLHLSEGFLEAMAVGERLLEVL